MTENLVSVIIPAYNHEKYVQETIQSVIDQTYQNIELIIIDDGSKDNTWQKIQEMKDICEKRFVRVHFETKENEGVCKTLNLLLDNAQGEYVALIASDDKYKPNAIEKEIEFLMLNPDYALCVGDNEIIDSDSKLAYWDKKRNLVYQKENAEYLSFAYFLQKILRINFLSNDFGSFQTLYVGNYIPNGYLIRKSIFDKIGYYTPDAPLEDWWLMLQISKYSKIKFIDEVLFSYRWHASNTIKNTEKMDTFAQKTRKYENKLLNEINNKNNWSNYLPEVQDLYRNGAKRLARNYFNIIKVETLIKPTSEKKRVTIKLFDISIFSYNKVI